MIFEIGRIRFENKIKNGETAVYSGETLLSYLHSNEKPLIVANYIDNELKDDNKFLMLRDGDGGFKAVSCNEPGKIYSCDTYKAAHGRVVVFYDAKHNNTMVAYIDGNYKDAFYDSEKEFIAKYGDLCRPVIARPIAGFKAQEIMMSPDGWTMVFNGARKFKSDKEEREEGVILAWDKHPGAEISRSRRFRVSDKFWKAYAKDSPNPSGLSYNKIASLIFETDAKTGELVISDFETGSGFERRLPKGEKPMFAPFPFHNDFGDDCSLMVIKDGKGGYEVIDESNPGTKYPLRQFETKNGTVLVVMEDTLVGSTLVIYPEHTKEDKSELMTRDVPMFKASFAALSNDGQNILLSGRGIETPGEYYRARMENRRPKIIHKVAMVSTKAPKDEFYDSVRPINGRVAGKDPIEKTADIIRKHTAGNAKTNKKE